MRSMLFQFTIQSQTEAARYRSREQGAAHGKAFRVGMSFCHVAPLPRGHLAASCRQYGPSPIANLFLLHEPAERRRQEAVRHSTNDLEGTETRTRQVDAVSLPYKYASSIAPALPISRLR